MIWGNQKIIVAGKTYKQIKDVFLAEWKKHIPSSKYTLRISDMEIDLPEYNSQLILRYAENPTGSEVLKGINATGYYIIQAESIYNEEFLKTAEERIRIEDENGSAQANDPRFLRLYDANAGNPLHYVNQRFIDPKSEIYYGNGRCSTIKIETTPETSVYSAEIINDWIKTWPTWRVEQFLKGNWVAAEGRIYDDYEIVDPIKPEEIESYWIGIDPGTSASIEDNGRMGNLALVWIGKYTGKNKFVIFAEKQISFTGMDNLVNLIKGVNEVYNPNKFDFLIKDWAGGSGEVFRMELPLHDIPVVPPSKDHKWKPVINGILALYEGLKTRRIVISKDCIHTIRDTHKYTWNEAGDQPNKKQFDSHLLDAWRYAWIRIHRMFNNE